MIKFAVGTDDGIEFTNEHFGSSGKYLIYDFDLKTKKITFVKTIENKTPEEQKHGDPKKAKNIGSLLKNMSIFIAKRMGPNINRIRKKFVPIICADYSIEETINLLPNYTEKIRSELNKPVEILKNIIKIK